MTDEQHKFILALAKLMGDGRERTGMEIQERLGASRERIVPAMEVINGTGIWTVIEDMPKRVRTYRLEEGPNAVKRREDMTDEELQEAMDQRKALSEARMAEHDAKVAARMGLALPVRAAGGQVDAPAGVGAKNQTLPSAGKKQGSGA